MSHPQNDRYREALMESEVVMPMTRYDWKARHEAGAAVEEPREAMRFEVIPPMHLTDTEDEANIDHE